MRKLLLGIVMFVSVVTITVAQEIKWVTMNEALGMQKKKPKKIFMDVYTTWCGPCRMLSKTTFSNKDFVKYINDNFYAVKFNAEGNEVVNFKDKTFKNNGYDSSRADTRNSTHDFTQALGVRAYPTMIIFDEKTQILTPLTGLMTAKQLEPIIKLFGENTYLKIDTQEKYEKYLKEFKSTFSE